MRQKCIFLAFLIAPLLFEKASCQDPQFSQFYAAPLYLNPAFAGSALEARIGLNYRNQWPQISNANFETFAAYFDTYFDEYNSGVGFIASTHVLNLSCAVFALQHAEHGLKRRDEQIDQLTGGRATGHGPLGAAVFDKAHPSVNRDP